MITIYSMSTCPDCIHIESQVKGDGRYEIIDIGAHVKNLKAFLRLRDSDPVFDDVRRGGFVGIPCFVLEDGTVTLNPEDAGLRPRSEEADELSGAACNLDGSGC